MDPGQKNDLKENILKTRGGRVPKREQTSHKMPMTLSGSANLENILINSLDQQWCELSEVIESDFLISPGDVYPNRKVELEDAEIKDSTRVSFDVLCEQQHEAFLKNNKDIGHT